LLDELDVAIRVLSSSRSTLPLVMPAKETPLSFMIELKIKVGEIRKFVPSIAVIKNGIIEEACVAWRATILIAREERLRCIATVREHHSSTIV
jgi:hypothetical protein